MLKLNTKKYKSSNIVSEKQIIKIIRKLQKQGKKVGLCTGSFDFLHPGHITHLIAAKKFCDILIVAIAKNKFSSNKYHGSGRPLFSDIIRAFMTSQLKPVDYIFLEDGIPETISKLKPDVYIKGIDYSDLKHPNIIKQKEMIESFNGEILFTKTEKISTTDIIRHIKEKIKI